MKNNPINNSELEKYIKSIAIGDQTALRQLYEVYKTPIYLFAMSITKNNHFAEDAMQDTFINIMTYAKSYQTGTNPKAWIFTICKHASLKVIRNSHQNDTFDIETFENTLYANCTNTIEDSIDSIESLKVLDCVELQIVLLYLYGGLKQTEIASTLELPYLKIRSKYYCAIRKLKQYYKERNNLYDKPEHVEQS